ncbi:hypothetical protein [Prevotella sp.]|uniref:hypothetical protein n=1 Tax=uncultured Prevotella sp. TaxID=159272 RepID=UPI0027E391FE|nr:hypothetical protein [uncultured Prevotella sp.]
MKKIFTLIFATLMAGNIMAQMHGALRFAGASSVKVLTTNIDNPSDTIKFEMASMSAGNITLPAMKGMATIPSFTIENVAFTMGDNHVISFADQTFASKVTVDGNEKAITGSSLSGTYNMADNSLTLKAVFKYGSMPASTTYNIKAYYVKTVSSPITVNVGGAFNYTNKSVSYDVRKYMDGDVQKADVEISTYTLENTVMGNLTLGTYTVKGLTYDESKGGFYRDYKDDNLTFHFTAENGGNKTMDGDYSFNNTKDNNILVKYSGNNITDIVNRFQMGSMPFAIESKFDTQSTGITSIKSNSMNDGKMYNLQGQEVSESYKGIVIVNGKKYLKK